MTPGQVGTYLVDGLLQGSTSASIGLEDDLADWVQLAAGAGYEFSLETDGGTFSLLGDGRARSPKVTGGSISEPLGRLLQQLLDRVPAETRGGFFSTIRTIAYGEGVETQSLYVLTNDGRVDVRQRIVDAETTAPPPPTDAKSLARTGVLAFLVLTGLFLISSVFIDYKDLFTKAWRQVAPLDTTTIKVEAGDLAPYLDVKIVDTAQSGALLKIEITRTRAFPQSTAEIERLLAGGERSLAERGALNALASGYVHLEQLGPKGVWQRTNSIRITELRTNEQMTVKLVFDRTKPPERLAIAW